MFQKSCTSATKEYAQFRRLWDDSGSLTRLNNGITAVRSFHPTPSGFSGGGGGRANYSNAEEGQAAEATATTTPFSAVNMKQLASVSRGATTAAAAAAAAGSSASTTWRQAMRSEWSSPSEKVSIGAVTETAATSPAPSPASFVPVTPAATAVGTAGAAVPEHKGNKLDKEDKEDKGEETNPLERGRERREVTGQPRATGGVPRPQRTTRTGQAVVTTVGAVEGKKEGGGVEPGARGCTLPGAGPCAKADDGAGTEDVRWGRVDLLSVLYPPPTAGESGLSKVLMFFSFCSTVAKYCGRSVFKVSVGRLINPQSGTFVLRSPTFRLT